YRKFCAGNGSEPTGTIRAGIEAATGRFPPSLRATAVKVAPITRHNAPRTTWAVAISAALFDQIVAAPNNPWHKTRASHNKLSLLTGFALPSALRLDQAQKATRPRIATAIIRWTICRPI